MGGAHGDSPWAFILAAMTYASRIWIDCSGSVCTVLTAVIWYALTGTQLDLLFNVALLALLNRQCMSYFIREVAHCVFIPFLSATLALGVLATLTSRGRQAANTWQGPGRPYLIPCRTTHRRLFPEKHSFSYSYLTVGVPVGYNGIANGMMEVDGRPPSGFERIFPIAKLLLRSWYRVQASDHFQRGHGGLDLRGKLDKYLQFEV